MSNYYRPGFGGFSFFPPVIKNLLIINAVVFFLQLLMNNLTIGGVPAWYTLNKWFALNPTSGVDNNGLPFNFQVWQLITYQFMHGGFGHIFFNLLMLWMFGMDVENTWGSRKFLYFYLLCGVVAGLFQLFLNPLLGGGDAVTIGASGAVYGVLVAFAMMFPDRYIFLYFLIPIKAKYLIVFIIIVYNIHPLFSGESNGVAHLAHLGGALAAFLYILFDKNTQVEIKNLFKRSSFRTSKPFNPFGSSSTFGNKKQDVQDANYYDIKDEDDKIDQQEIDAILDKISRSGYQNLTEREKRILFQASKKMK